MDTNVNETTENVKGVLLTTMSTLTNSTTVNYYFREEAGEKRYCTGVSQLEAGSKYILSEYKIDKILAICSNETIYKESDPDEGTLVDFKFNNDEENICDEGYGNKPDWYDEVESNGIKGAYLFYLYRMAHFLSNKDDDSIECIMQKKLKKVDCKEIQKIVNTYFSEIQNDEIEFKKGIEEINKRVSALFDIEKQSAEKSTMEEAIAEEAIVDEMVEEKHKEDILENETETEINNGKRGLWYRFRSLFIPSSKSETEPVSTIKEEEKTVEKPVDVSVSNSRIEEEKPSDVSVGSNRTNKEKENAQNYGRYCFYKNYVEKEKLIILKPNAYNKPDSVSFKYLPEKNEAGYDNIVGIINELRTGWGTDATKPVKVKLYIDMQGGSRTQAFIKNTIIQILNNQGNYNISVEEVVAIDFERKNAENEILKETARYKISDLAAGMNAFIRYGKADMLLKYIDDIGIPEGHNVRELVNCMKKVDDAISTCDVNYLETAIKFLNAAIRENGSNPNSENNEDGMDETSTEEKKNQVPNKEEQNIENASQYFELLKDGINDDYGNLLTGNTVDTIDLIEWCIKKDFIQQALTIVQSKMPEYFINNFTRIYVDIKDKKDKNFGYHENYVVVDKQLKNFKDIKDSPDFSQAVKSALNSGSQYDTRWEFVLFDKLNKGYKKEYFDPKGNKVDKTVHISNIYVDGWPFSISNGKYHFSMGNLIWFKADKCNLSNDKIMEICRKAYLSVATSEGSIKEKLQNIHNKDELKKVLKDIANILFGNYTQLVSQRNEFNHAATREGKKKDIVANLECFITAAKIYRAILYGLNDISQTENDMENSTGIINHDDANQVIKFETDWNSILEGGKKAIRVVLDGESQDFSEFEKTKLGQYALSEIFEGMLAVEQMIKGENISEDNIKEAHKGFIAAWNIWLEGGKKSLGESFKEKKGTNGYERMINSMKDNIEKYKKL